MLATLKIPAAPTPFKEPPIRLTLLPAAELLELEPDALVGDGVNPIGPVSVVDTVAAEDAEETLYNKR